MAPIRPVAVPRAAPTLAVPTATPFWYTVNVPSERTRAPSWLPVANVAEVIVVTVVHGPPIALVRTSTRSGAAVVSLT